jgi:hypothetical protein
MCEDKVDATMHFEKDVDGVAGLSRLSCLFWGRRCLSAIFERRVGMVEAGELVTS